jgi:hypothetical protein
MWIKKGVKREERKCLPFGLEASGEEDEEGGRAEGINPSSSGVVRKR